MAAGAQNLLLALAVPLISPFELQHQIFREHPAPEQLFLIATPQHCCPCLYINIYSEPRTEHQSSALPPPPAPALPLQPLPGRRAAVPRRTLPPPCCYSCTDSAGRARALCPVPAACAAPPWRGPQHAPLAGRSCAHLWQRPGLPPCWPSPPRARTAPPRRCLGIVVSGERGLSLWRCSTMVWRRQRVEGGCAGSGAGAQQGRESRSPVLGWMGVLPVPPA